MPIKKICFYGRGLRHNLNQGPQFKFVLISHESTVPDLMRGALGVQAPHKNMRKYKRKSPKINQIDNK